MSCDVGEAAEGLENELRRRWSDGKLGEWALLIIQVFRHFTYVTAHASSFPSLHLRHSSFSNPSVASPTSHLILQPFFCFSYVTGFSLTSPAEPPMVQIRLFLHPVVDSKLVHEGMKLSKVFQSCYLTYWSCNRQLAGHNLT